MLDNNAKQLFNDRFNSHDSFVLYRGKGIDIIKLVHLVEKVNGGETCCVLRSSGVQYNDVPV